MRKSLLYFITLFQALFLIAIKCEDDLKTSNHQKPTHEQVFDHIEKMHDDRVFYVNVPTNTDHQKKNKAVIGIHGYNSTGLQFAKITNLHKDALQKGYIMATAESYHYQQQQKPSWNAGECCGKAKSENIDDVQYFSDMIDILIEKYNVDPELVFVVGWSNGGSMAYRLACELSGKIAGIVPFASSILNKKIPIKKCKADRLLEELNIPNIKQYELTYECQNYEFWLGLKRKTEYSKCKQEKEVPMMVIYGNADPIAWPDGVIIEESNPENDDEIQQIVICPPTKHGPRYFREKYNCGSENDRQVYYSTNKNDNYDYTSCERTFGPSEKCKTPVIECVAHKAGHFWWSAKEIYKNLSGSKRALFGPITDTFDMNERILMFFDDLIFEMEYQRIKQNKKTENNKGKKDDL